LSWHLPGGFRGQALVIGLASLSMATLAAILVQDAWRSTQRRLAEEAQQQCSTAVRELREQFTERASLLGTAGEALPFEAHDLSLRGLSAAVLRSYEAVEGGFFLGRWKRLAGHADPFGRPEDQTLREIETRLVQELVSRAAETSGVVAGSAEDGRDLLVAAAAAVKSRDAVAWTLKRLAGANDPAAQRRRWWLAGLVLSAVLGLGAVVSISIRLRQGVDSLSSGLTRLESDFIYRLPPIRGEFGRVAQAINQMADRRSALEATLRQQDRLAALGKVVAGVAHEIRNPLNSLRLTLELLLRRIQKGSATGEEVRAAIEEVDRLDAILARLLAFGRPELENRQVQDIRPLLERAVRVVQDQSQRKEIEVTVAGPERRPLTADVDALAVEQVLINLLLNAIEASPVGGRVQVRAAAEQQALRIEVRDEGCGISEQVLDHIFDPYFTTKENGTGLGLAVSREIAGHHGGSLEVESNGDGTTFVLRLPSTRSEG
jgi:signal transduction histidine kinase